MKKIISFFLFASSVVCFASATPHITEEFYLNNGELHDENIIYAKNVLPNTLRLNLSEGETGELYADIMPDNASDKTLNWSLPQKLGKIDIYPKGKECMVVGVLPGEEKVTVTTSNGLKADIAVSVKESGEARIRSFEIDAPSSPRKSVSSFFIRALCGTLLSVGTMLIAFGVLLLIFKGGLKGKK